MAPVYVVLVMVFFRETECDRWLWPAGLLIFGVGVGMRVWAQMHLHYRLRVRKTLTMTGPYRFIRNPIYIANTMMLLGVTVLSELLWFLPIMLVWCVMVYGLVVRREERHLSEKYGEEYRAYLAAVPRWLPRIGGREPGRETGGHARQFLLPSLRAEVHCLLLLIPLIGKEIFSDLWM